MWVWIVIELDRIYFHISRLMLDRGLFLWHAPGAPDNFGTESTLHFRPARSGSKLWRMWCKAIWVDLIKVQGRHILSSGDMCGGCRQILFENMTLNLLNHCRNQFTEYIFIIFIIVFFFQKAPRAGAGMLSSHTDTIDQGPTSQRWSVITLLNFRSCTVPHELILLA